MGVVLGLGRPWRALTPWVSLASTAEPSQLDVALADRHAGPFHCRQGAMLASAVAVAASNESHGKTDALGRIIRWDNGLVVRAVGIMKG